MFTSMLYEILTLSIVLTGTNTKMSAHKLKESVFDVYMTTTINNKQVLTDNQITVSY